MLLPKHVDGLGGCDESTLTQKRQTNKKQVDTQTYTQEVYILFGTKGCHKQLNSSMFIQKEADI